MESALLKPLMDSLLFNYSPGTLACLLGIIPILAHYFLLARKGKTEIGMTFICLVHLLLQLHDALLPLVFPGSPRYTAGPYIQMVPRTLAIFRLDIKRPGMVVFPNVLAMAVSPGSTGVFCRLVSSALATFGVGLYIMTLACMGLDTVEDVHRVIERGSEWTNTAIWLMTLAVESRRLPRSLSIQTVTYWLPLVTIMLVMMDLGRSPMEWCCRKMVMTRLRLYAVTQTVVTVPIGGLKGIGKHFKRLGWPGLETETQSETHYLPEGVFDTSSYRRRLIFTLSSFAVLLMILFRMFAIQHLRV